ncbi:DMT family transporter [Catenulispora rubra]|uniref:DMT family transporter n=1 Tax=Catenulispora rubra TaxID=280293 RepID=UPI002B275ED5|nr:DMT family transporter [Catenulispora rubra]
MIRNSGRAPPNSASSRHSGGSSPRAATASLLISIAPVFSVLLAAAFLGERLTSRVVAGSLIALAGAALVALGGLVGIGGVVLIQRRSGDSTRYKPPSTASKALSIIH